MKVSEKIRYLRKSENITQKELGEKLGITGHNVFDWEKGKGEPSLDMLKKLADFFGVSVGYLVGTEDESGRPVSSDLPQKDLDLLKAFHKLGAFEQETILIQINALAEKVKN